MSYSPPKYPASIPDQVTDLPDRTDDIDWIEAWIYNYVKKELVAVMTELGVDPAGAEATVAARLTAIEAAGVDESVILNIYLNSFRIAVLGSYAVMNMAKGISDEYEDETGIDTTASTGESYDSDNDLYSPVGVAKATGGTITYDGDYVIHTFLSDGTFTPASGFNVEYLVVGGGASGGNNIAGGGGAGGFRTGNAFAVTAQAYSIVVGAGGASQATGNTVGNNGVASSFSTISSAGGGGGGAYSSPNGQAGSAGGSGGGGGTAENGTAGVGGAGDTPDTTPDQGKSGGDAGNRGGAGNYTGGGGGGGASAVGGNYVTVNGGAGGAGTASTIYDGSSITYAGGGGGSAHSGSGGVGGVGGAGGGGAGGATSAGTAGTANTGGGGGGGVASGAGGSGIVIIRYLGTVDNMILISEKFTADTESDDARIVIFEEDVDAITLNTDIKAYVSRDDGANWTQITLTDEGNYSGSKRILTGEADISAQPSGTDMVYKITTLNEKDLKLYGTALSWA